MLVKLTRWDGKAVFVNPLLVCIVDSHNYGTKEKANWWTRVTCEDHSDDKTGIPVKGTLDEAAAAVSEGLAEALAAMGNRRKKTRTRTSKKKPTTQTPGSTSAAGSNGSSPRPQEGHLVKA